MSEARVNADPYDDPDEVLDDGPRGLVAVFGPTLNAMFAPQAAFDALKSRPVLAIWPVLWVTLLAIVMGVFNADVTRQVWRVSMIEGMQRRGQTLDPEQLRPMLERVDAWAPILAPVQNIFLVLMVVLVAVLFWIASSLAGGRTRFSRAFGVAAIGAVISPLLVIVFVTLMWQIDPPVFRRMDEFARATPTLSLALFAGNAELSIFWRTLLGACSVFNAWWVYVSAVGCRTLLEIKSGAAWGVPIAIWVVSALVGAGLAAMGGG